MAAASPPAYRSIILDYDSSIANGSFVVLTTASALTTAFDAVTALLHGSSGILVTRHDYWQFSVEVTSEVPFGVIMEKDACCRLMQQAKPLQPRPHLKAPLQYSPLITK